MSVVYDEVNGIETILRIDFSFVEPWQFRPKKVGVIDVD